MQNSLLGALTLARPDSRERLVTAVLLPGPLPERAIVQKLKSDQDESKTRRAIKRLIRDSLVAVANGLLSIVAQWWTWHPHRLDPKHARQLERSRASTGQQDDNSAAVVDDRVVPAADPPMGDRDAERLEKIACRAGMVFGPEVADELRRNGQSILRSADGVKNLMAALLQSEGRVKPHPNPIALLIVIARKFAETGIPEALWGKLEVDPLPLGTKRAAGADRVLEIAIRRTNTGTATSMRSSVAHS